MSIVAATAMLLLVALMAWRGTSAYRTAVAALLVVAQVFFLLKIDLLGRPVMAEVIQSGGPVRAVSEALQRYKELARPHALALIIASVGLFVLAAFGRRPK
jgi:hypothetical protein